MNETSSYEHLLFGPIILLHPKIEMCGITGAYLRDGGMISNDEYENFNNSLMHRGA